MAASVGAPTTSHAPVANPRAPLLPRVRPHSRRAPQAPLECPQAHQQFVSSSGPSAPSNPWHPPGAVCCHRRPPPLIMCRQGPRRHTHVCRAAEAGQQGADEVYPLEKTQVLVETAMLAAVGGLCYLMAAVLKLETSIGYFLPMPVVLAAMRGGPMAGVKTMTTTALLIVVLLGPLRAISYILMHGLLASTLGALWRTKSNFWLCVVAGAAVRMGGQFAYVVLSSVTMNENLFSIMLANAYSFLDQLSASLRWYGTPSPLAIVCLLFAMLLVNALCYTFLLQIIYRVLLGIMGYQLGPLPGIVRKYLYSGMPDPQPAAKRTE